MEHHQDIVDYLNSKGAIVILLFRRNTLRRLISVLANNYDRRTKQLNGIHKSHVHSKEEVWCNKRKKNEPIVIAKDGLSDILLLLLKTTSPDSLWKVFHPVRTFCLGRLRYSQDSNQRWTCQLWSQASETLNIPWELAWATSEKRATWSSITRMWSAKKM